MFRTFSSIALMWAVTTFSADAAVVYSYSGNAFTDAAPPYTTDMSVSLQFETASPLSATGMMTNVTSQILSYTMFDGVGTLTEADSAISVFVNIDAATGLPRAWSIDATNEFGAAVNDIANRMGTFYDGVTAGRDRVEALECVVILGTGECAGNLLAFAQVNNAPGSWSVVPVPAAVWLFGSGLIALLGLGRRECGRS